MNLTVLILKTVLFWKSFLGFNDDAPHKSTDTINGYTYDTNGNLISDLNKKISLIEPVVHYKKVAHYIKKSILY